MSLGAVERVMGRDWSEDDSHFMLFKDRLDILVIDDELDLTALSEDLVKPTDPRILSSL